MSNSAFATAEAIDSARLRVGQLMSDNRARHMRSEDVGVPEEDLALVLEGAKRYRETILVMEARNVL